MDNKENIFKIIKEEFCSLWNFKERGDTLEIITPFSTTNAKFISVFVTRKTNKLIVTDGGWMMGGEYDIIPDIDDEIFYRIYEHYLNYYKIKVYEHVGYKYYYKSIDEIELLSSLVYDLAHFMSSIISVSQIEFYDYKEKSERETFKNDANRFIGNLLQNKNIIFNKELSQDYKAVRFNAIITQGPKIKLVRYITGSTTSYFLSSLTKATVDFEIANNSRFNSHIAQRVGLINDTAQGFAEAHLFRHIHALEEHTKRDIVKWSERDTLIPILQ